MIVSTPSWSKITGLLTVVTCVALGCSKGTDKSLATSHREAIGLYTGKVWRLRELSINGQQQSITAAYKDFSRTFYNTGVYADSDGFTGTWTIDDKTGRKLSIAKQTVGQNPLAVDFTIEQLNPHYMVLRHNVNNNEYRVVYAL